MSLKHCLLWLLTLAGFSCANFPLLDVDTNMRIVLVPYDTPVGTIIYRLRASDSDNNFPLTFEVLGALGKSLLSLNFLGCVESESLCQADVVLKKRLDVGRTYEFQIQVKDTTGDYTKVHATITSTAGTSNFNPLFGTRILHLAEDCEEGTILEKFEVLKNELNSRVVLLEMRDAEERIGLKQRLVSNNRTEGTLFLKKKLDYETQPWFTFQLLAMNGWTNSTTDTRNILVADIIVAVHDVQDTPPVFTILPASVELNSSIKMGDLVVKIEAVDGDKQDKRLIRYGFLTDSNPFVAFFDLDPMNGEIRLRRNISELLRIAKPHEPIKMTIIAEEIGENGRFGRSSTPALERAVGNITFWFGKGSSMGPPAFSSDKYIGQVEENSLPGTAVQFGSLPLSVSHPNPGERLSLSLTNPGESSSLTRRQFIGPMNSNNIYNRHQQPQDSLVDTFELIPSHGVGNFSFEVKVADSKLLDFELYPEIRLMLIGSTQSGLSSEVEFLVHLIDQNDSPPIFSQSEYRVSIPEHSPVGTKVIVLRATDKDSSGSGNGQVVYSSLLGSDAFHLDPETGEITVDKPELLDRELEPEIRLYVEAKDGGYTEFTNPNAVRNIATATVIVKLQDKNDQAPEFSRKYYQAVLNQEMTAFKTPLFVKAFDLDEGANGQVKYVSLDSKFFVDPLSGEVRVRGTYHRNPAAGDGPYLGSFRIKAHDLGNPQQSAETVVQLFSEEMVTREIQFIFPATPDKIRQNQTNIEKMLSSLTGGIVGIQKIMPINSATRSSFVDSKGRRIPLFDSNGNPITGEPNDFWSGGESDGNNGQEYDDKGAGRSLLGSSETNNPPNPLRKPISREPINGESQRQNKAEGLSSSSDKSLVTATVQYPVSVTTTRVDLSAFQREYGNNGGDNRNGERTLQKTPDGEMIKLYEAENRALFWILITFLLILLILFLIFLCCVYCPCCWLYNQCYSKGAKSATRDREIVERVVVEKKRHGRKTYPTDDTEDSYDNDPEGGSYRRGPPPPRHVRREAWSGEEQKRSWRGGGGSRRYRERPPTPPKGRSQRQGRAQEGDVALEDWDFEPTPRDRAEEIGPRWQNMQHQQVMAPPQPPQPQTITVPIPMSMMSLPMQQQFQQQMMPMAQQQQSRRVGYVGHPHPGDEDFVRHPPRPRTQEQQQQQQNQGQFAYIEMERSQSQALQQHPHPRHYPGGTAPGPDSGKSLRQRETRFFKTETGEVLQFADMEGDEGKELLMKRYMDDHQQQAQIVEGFTGPIIQEASPSSASRSRALVRESSEEIPTLPAAPSVTSSVDRPRAAVVTKRQPKVPEPEKHEEEEGDEILIRDEPSGSGSKKSKSKSKSSKSSKKSVPVTELETEAVSGPVGDKKDNKDKSRAKRHQQRSVSLNSEEVEVESDGGKNREKSKSKSVGRNRSKSKSTSKSRSRSRSNSPKQVLKSKSITPPENSVTKSKSSSKNKTVTKSSLKKKEPSSSPVESTEKVSKSDRAKKHKSHSKSNNNKKEEEEGEKVTAPAPIPTIISETKHEAEEEEEEASQEIVDINIIPPSSAAMTEENDNENEEASNSLPQTPANKEEEMGKQDQVKVKDEVGESHEIEGDNNKEVKVEAFNETTTITTSTTTTTTSQGVIQQITTQTLPVVAEEQGHENDDEDSGIGISGGISTNRNKMLEKKSVFTIAYDEVAQKTLTMRPDTGNNSNNEGEGEIASAS